LSFEGNSIRIEGIYSGYSKAIDSTNETVDFISGSCRFSAVYAGLEIRRLNDRFDFFSE
jgi:hypothetical protein